VDDRAERARPLHGGHLGAVARQRRHRELVLNVENPREVLVELAGFRIREGVIGLAGRDATRHLASRADRLSEPFLDLRDTGEVLLELVTIVGVDAGA
jgi:hypothetical protein